MIPVIGDLMDGINAAIYALRGKWFDASISGGAFALAFVGGSSVPTPALRRALNLAARADELRDALRIAGAAAEAAKSAGKTKEAAQLATAVRNGRGITSAFGVRAC